MNRDQDGTLDTSGHQKKDVDYINHDRTSKYTFIIGLCEQLRRSWFVVERENREPSNHVVIQKIILQILERDHPEIFLKINSNGSYNI